MSSEGRTGFMFKSEDPMDLARAIETYFSSELFTQLPDATPAHSRLCERPALRGPKSA